MGRIIEDALTADRLNRAWNKIRVDGKYWVRGIPIRDIERTIIVAIAELAESVRSGTYTPEPMHCFKLNKENGQQRTVCTANCRDRLLQRAVLDALAPLGDAIFHPSSFAYRPQRSRDMAVERLRQFIRDGATWIMFADIRDCFDSIPRGPVLRRLQRLCGDWKATGLVHQWIQTTPIGCRNPENGLPQGMVLSPFLSNLYLNTLDWRLNRLGLRFVRFADNLAIACTGRKDAERTLRIVKWLLCFQALQLNSEKTFVTQVNSTTRYLGHPVMSSTNRLRLVAVTGR